MIIFGEHSTESMYSLSKRVNISETLLSGYKSGRVTPSLVSARRIAETVGVPLSELIFAGETQVDGRTRKN